MLAKSKNYKERNVQSKKREVFVSDSSAFVSDSSGRHVVSQCPKQKYFPPVLVAYFHISGG